MTATVGSGVGEIIASSVARAPWGWALLASAILALVKVWPVLKKLGSEERAGDFKRLREDVTEIKREASEARAVAQRLENMVACMRPAITILTAEVRRLDPGNSTNAAILQVQELMAMAAAGDLGMTQGLVALATVEGVGQ